MKERGKNEAPGPDDTTGPHTFNKNIYKEMKKKYISHQAVKRQKSYLRKATLET